MRKNRELSESMRNGMASTMRMFAKFLSEVMERAPIATELVDNPDSWQSITSDLVEEFKHWQKGIGLSTTTVNNRLVYIRLAARRALDEGAIDYEKAKAICDVETISIYAGEIIDKRRKSDGLSVRVGTQKAKHIELSKEQRTKLKEMHSNTPQGRRDRVIMCLLLDHGLKTSELAGITVGDLGAYMETISVCRGKAKERYIIEPSQDTRSALLAYVHAGDCPTRPDDKLLRASLRSGELSHAGLSQPSYWYRVSIVGMQIGIINLSPNDCRRSFADQLRERSDLSDAQKQWALGLANSEQLIRKYRQDADYWRERCLRAESALRSQQYASPRMAGVMDWSSTDISG